MIILLLWNLINNSFDKFSTGGECRRRGWRGETLQNPRKEDEEDGQKRKRPVKEKGNYVQYFFLFEWQ